jgi:hypothetical protein
MAHVQTHPSKFDDDWGKNLTAALLARFFYF